MRVSIERMKDFDGKTCFICGEFLLNNRRKDLAYHEVHTGRSRLMKPERYHLFACPNCGKIAHKRCWYDVGLQKVKKNFFMTAGWRLVCPSCGFEVAPLTKERKPWNMGYQIPGHPDEELIELWTGDVLAWKAGSLFGKVGKTINNFFRAVGLGSLTDPERSSVARAAEKVGRTLSTIAKQIFKLDIPEEERSEIKALTCQNCGAPLPLPGPGESAVVCEHCGTAHLL